MSDSNVIVGWVCGERRRIWRTIKWNYAPLSLNVELLIPNNFYLQIWVSEISSFWTWIYVLLLTNQILTLCSIHMSLVLLWWRLWIISCLPKERDNHSFGIWISLLSLINLCCKHTVCWNFYLTSREFTYSSEGNY